MPTTIYPMMTDGGSPLMYVDGNPMATDTPGPPSSLSVTFTGITKCCCINRSNGLLMKIVEEVNDTYVLALVPGPPASQNCCTSTYYLEFWVTLNEYSSLDGMGCTDANLEGSSAGLCEMTVVWDVGRKRVISIDFVVLWRPIWDEVLGKYVASFGNENIFVYSTNPTCDSSNTVNNILVGDCTDESHAPWTDGAGENGSGAVS